MQTTQFARLSGMVLAVMLTLLVGSVRADNRTLEGIWDVTLTFGNCNDPTDPPPTPANPGCSCPPSPSHTASGLHMYLKNGSYLDVSGTDPVRGPALGSWERVGHHRFEALYKFILFNRDFSRRGYEVVKNSIHLTDPNKFKSHATFHFYNTGDTQASSPEEGCPIDESATRVEFVEFE